MDARQSRRGKRISKQQEDRAAAQLGGRTMAASGATRLGGGGDVRVMGKIRLECKVTEKDVYVLKLNELEKLKKQAIKTLEYPVFQFAFRGATGRLEQYAVIQWDEPELAHTHWGTESKGFHLRSQGLRAALSLGTVMLTFHTKGPLSLKSQYFRIMAWDDFVKRQNENA